MFSKLRRRIRAKRSDRELARFVRLSAAAIPGSREWLIGKEAEYGGFVTGVPRDVVSPYDPRSESELREGGMTGGDRMFHHGYGAKYAEYLLPWAAAGRPLTLVEIGVLQGSGLALWCDLFPQGRILGLDIDLSHVRRSLPTLKQRGAFRSNEPELHEFDQFVDNRDLLASILGGDRIELCIDDGFHSEESILRTMESVLPHLAERFVYFIEDNDRIHHEIERRYPQLEVDSEGELTVLSRGVRRG